MKEMFDCSKFKYRTFQYFAAVGGGLGMVSLGMHYGWPLRALPLITAGNYSFRITSSEESYLIAMLPIGSLLGDIFVVATLCEIGHSKLITATSIPLFVSWILMAYAPSKPYMFFGRFLAGLGDGVLFTTLPPYLAEIAEPEIRGFLGATCMVSIVLGMLLMNSSFFFASLTSAALVASLISLLTLLILPFLPESPYFYLTKKDVLTAKASLQKFNGKGEVVEELYRISKGIMEEGDDCATLSDLFHDRHFRKSFLVALLGKVAQYFCGALAVVAYATTTVFKESQHLVTPETARAMLFAVIFISSSVSMMVIDFAGRRALMMVSTGMVCLMLFLDASYLYIQTATDIDISGLYFIHLLVIFMFAVSFAFGLHSVPAVVASEILSTKFRIIGIGLLNFMFSLVSIAVLVFFYCAKHSFGIFVPFYCFGCVSILTFVLVIVFLPEMKKKSLEDIQANIRGVNCTN